MPSYPSHLVQRVALADGTPVTIRPIRRDDGALAQEFVRNLSDESRYYRFMDSLRELTPRMVSHFTEVDHQTHLALIAVIETTGRETEVGAARCVASADRQSGEFSIVVADEWQRKGLGTRLLQALIEAARGVGMRRMHGDVLATNARMLRFVARLGFGAQADPVDARLVRVELALSPVKRMNR
jgi:acetyltransferase